MFRPIMTILAVFALAGAGAACAQASGDAMHSMDKMHKMNSMHDMQAKRMQTHLAKLKSWVKITSAQEPAWNRFAQAMRAMHPAMKHEMKPDASKLVGAKIFEAMAMRAEQRAQNAQVLAKAANNLYGQLSSDQKAAWNMAMGKMLTEKHRKMMRKHRMHKMHDMQGMRGSAAAHG